jgi:PAS domain S-box-containing protein
MSESDRSSVRRRILAGSVAWRIALVYALVGAAWILLSDIVVGRVFGEEIGRLKLVQTLKGTFYILAPAGLLYVLIRKGMRQLAQADAARRESEERYERLTDVSPDGIIVHDNGTILYANRAMATMLGLASPEQLVGRTVFDIVHPDYHELARQRIGALRDGRQAVPLLEERLVRADGSERWVEIGAAPLQYAGRPAAIAVVRDIALRRAAQERLLRSEASLARAQEIARLGSWEWNLATNEVTWSRQMYKIFGMPEDGPPLSLETFVKLLRHDERAAVTGAIERALQNGGSFDIDYHIAGPDGVERSLHAQGEAQTNGAGTPVRLFGTVQDVTARQRIEQELRSLNETLEHRVAERTAELQEANEDLRAFAYSISHGLRAPLRSMRGFALALLEDLPGKVDETESDYLRRIVAASARMDRLIVDLLEYSQLLRRQIVPQRISLVLVLHDVVGQIRRDPLSPEADINIIEPMPWVLAHRATLATVLSNLLSNALKFVEAGTRPNVTVRAEDRGTTTRLWIEDNGIGIAPEHQEQIFHVFERLHANERYPGAGIGLAIVRRGVERMGGNAGVKSDVGKGSRFWIELPKDPESP